MSLLFQLPQRQQLNNYVDMGEPYKNIMANHNGRRAYSFLFKNNKGSFEKEAEVEQSEANNTPQVENEPIPSTDKSKDVDGKDK
jgi:hypothetical protein